MLLNMHFCLLAGFSGCNWSGETWHCCSSSNPCGLFEGDCNGDYGCAGNLLCGYDNCYDTDSSFHQNADCCMLDTQYCLDCQCLGGDNLLASDQCYRLDAKKATNLTKMSTRRAFAASVVLNQTTLWISGGRDDTYSYLSSSEFIQKDSTVPGPHLPKPMDAHAMIKISNELVLIIGGRSSEILCSDQTFECDHDGECTQGPSLKTARHSHSVGIVIDEVNQEKLVIAAGGYGSNCALLQSTEILANNEWISGTYLYIFYNFPKLNVKSLLLLFMGEKSKISIVVLY